MVARRRGTVGRPFNEGGGGVYALEWDPDKEGAIRSWVFPRSAEFEPEGRGSYLPDNLRRSMLRRGQPGSARPGAAERPVPVLDPDNTWQAPDPAKWGLPYAYFKIGDDSECKKEHFGSMRLIFNLAFCGSVAGNKFKGDCPVEHGIYGGCEGYVNSEEGRRRIEMEARWEVESVYVFERTISKENK